MPVGKWVMRMAESVLLTFCPPLPDERKVSMRISSGSMTISLSLLTWGDTSTLAKLV